MGRYKISMQKVKSFSIYQNNEQAEKEIRKTNPSTTA
jgi:hypothetical protein